MPENHAAQSPPCFSPSITVVLLICATLLARPVEAQEGNRFREPSLPAGAPFSLNAYDAVNALYLLRRAAVVGELTEGGTYRWIWISRVRAVRLPDAENPLTPFERKRYDISINGQPLNWERSYIEYDGRMVNLRLLYTYRNGGLPSGLRYESRQD